MIEQLTQAEKQIIFMAAQGYGCKEIAVHMKTSPQVIFNKRCEIKRKLNAETFSHVIFMYYAQTRVRYLTKLASNRLDF